MMPFIWVAISIPILVLLQRWIHMHLHGIALLLLGNAERAVLLYALVLFPGVLLHEVSHWLFATLLGVRTGKFSLIPQRQRDGSVRLGYVEYFKGPNLGPIRESLIGGAPMITGTAVILLMGLHIFNINDFGAAVQSGNIDLLGTAIGAFFYTDDLLVWVYLLFAVANGMLPSRSDRQAWPAFLLIFAVVTVGLYLIGLGGFIMDGLAEPATVFFSYLGLAFTLAICTNLLCMLILSAIEAAISAMRGRSIVYGKGK
jgi:hypothetical protein